MATPYARNKPLTQCDHCKSARLEITTNRLVYGEDAIEPDARICRCHHCGASVALHPGTDIPMGTMADKRLRALRHQTHLEFDVLWKYNSRLSRAAAYGLLQQELGISCEECHIAMMSREQLRQVIAFAKHYMSAAAETERRRKDKKHERRIKRAERAATLESQKRREKREALQRRPRPGRYG